MNDTGPRAAKGQPSHSGVLDGPRAPLASEREDLVTFLNSVFRHGRLGENIEEQWAPLYAESNLRNLRIIRSGGQIVASAGTWIADTRAGGSTVRVGGINLVGTHRDFRRRGLASQVLQACMEHLRREGCQLSLLRSALDDFYRKQGWESAVAKRVFHLDRGNRGLVERDGSMLIRSLLESDFAAISRMHLARELGSARAEETTRAIFRRPARHTLVAVRESGVTAYVHGLAGTRASVQEYAGAPEEVLSLIRAYYETLDEPAAPTSMPPEEFARSTLHLEVQTPGFGDRVGDSLAHLGIPAAEEYVGMWRILDLEALLERFKGRSVTGRVEKGEVVLSHHGVASRYSPSQAVKALFGPERPGEFARICPPLPLWQWETDVV